ncbi:MAG: DUF1700 domain-containing protein [Clostridiaceae bacterium]
MKRRNYLLEFEKLLNRAPVSEKEDALRYYNELFDEEGIDIEDEVPEKYPSPRQAAFEILRDIEVVNISENNSEPRKKGRINVNTFAAVILSILALPIALPLSIALAAVAVALLIALFAIFAALVIAAFAAVISGITIITSNFPPTTNVLSLSLGLILAGTGGLILLINGAKSVVTGINNKLIELSERKQSNFQSVKYQGE